MTSINKSQYKWTFSERSETGSDIGFNEPMTENFKKYRYASLVREAIQNSLDVVLDKTKPVKVEFTIKSMGRGIDTKAFFDIHEHISSCKEYYSQYSQAEKIYGPMLNYLKRVNGEYNNRLHYIKVADYNTTGMTYIPRDTNNAFYAFVRAAGVSFKENASAGGSFGFGKAAYFYLSVIRTLFISTVDKDGNCFFEGVSSLCTHRMNGKKVEAIGYYDCNNGEPVTADEQILSRFKRCDEDGKPIPGTDINIMGIDLNENSKEEIYQEMRCAVLRNFWLAIYENRLIVTIGDDTISKENLTEEIESAFEELEDNKKSTYQYNPRPYFETVKNVNTSAKYAKYTWQPDKYEYYNSKFVKSVTKNQKSGVVELYLFKNKQGSNRILYMRDPRMVVERKKHSMSNGFYGVFVVRDGYVNEFLRLIENPAHNEWIFNNIGGNYAVKNIVKTLIDDYKKFVSDSLEDFFKISSGTILTIKGLDQYLYIPTDVDTDDDEEDTMEAYSANPVGELKNDGTSITTDADNSITMNNDSEKIGRVVIKKQNTARSDEDGNLLNGKSDKPIQNPGTGIGTKPKNRNIESIDGAAGTYLTHLPVKYRSFAMVIEGKIYHQIIIHSKNSADNCEVHLEVGGDESIDVVNVEYSDVGTPENNKVVNIPIVEGRNLLRIRFADNLKHSIKLVAYENK